MKSIEEFNNSKVPLVIIDNRLDVLDNVILFPEKVELARKTIAKIGLPKQSISDKRIKNC